MLGCHCAPCGCCSGRAQQLPFLKVVLFSLSGVQASSLAKCRHCSDLNSSSGAVLHNVRSKMCNFTSALAAFQSGCKALKHDLWCSSCFPFSCCYFLGKNILSRVPTPCYFLRRCPIHSEGNCTALLLDCLLLSKARLLLLSCAKSCAIFKAAFLFFLSFFFFLSTYSEFSIQSGLKLSTLILSIQMSVPSQFLYNGLSWMQ